jgi:hypothetical protein
MGCVIIEVVGSVPNTVKPMKETIKTTLCMDLVSIHGSKTINNTKDYSSKASNQGTVLANFQIKLSMKASGAKTR